MLRYAKVGGGCQLLDKVYLFSFLAHSVKLVSQLRAGGGRLKSLTALG